MSFQIAGASFRSNRVLRLTRYIEVGLKYTYFAFYWEWSEPTLSRNIFNPLRTKLYLSHLKTQSVPRSKHSASVIKTSQLMLYREIIAV